MFFDVANLKNQPAKEEDKLRKSNLEFVEKSVKKAHLGGLGADFSL